MAYINTTVVRALMQLQGITPQTLATLARVTRRQMGLWLSGAHDDAVELDTQLEVLNYLGIKGESPRADVVHHWQLHEPLFSRSRTVYEPLAIMLKAFGRAQISYVARELDPTISLKNQAFFALKFGSFYAMLDITAHPLRSISFDPENMQGLYWAQDAQNVLLPASHYDAIEPGAMRVKQLNNYLTYTAEMSQWDRLRANALEHGIRASSVVTAMHSLQPHRALGMADVQDVERVQRPGPAPATSQAASDHIGAVLKDEPSAASLLRKASPLPAAARQPINEPTGSLFSA